MKILFFTGSRSEWGYIRPILEICKKEKIKYDLIISNTHVLESFGLSKKEMINDGFKISDEIYMTLDGYNPTTTAKSLGIFATSFSDTLRRIRPDWVLLAGDRGETFMAGVVAAYSNFPIAHIQAGELSGNIDGQARHALGKFSHLHFASNKNSVERLSKLGEQSFRIFNVGAPQLDDLKNSSKIQKAEKKFLGLISKKDKYILSVFHPVTERYEKIKKDFNIYCSALKKLNMKRIWISSNSDSGSLILKNEFNKLRSSNDIVFDNLPRYEYLYLLKHCQFISGNSSSGIIEAATYKKACVNVGRRQNKRDCSKNVIHVKNLSDENLRKAFDKALSKNFQYKLKKIKNIYGNGNSSSSILKVIKNTKIDEKLLTKDLTF